MADNFWKVRHGLTIGSKTSDPSNPIEGDVYFNSTRGVYRKYESGAWFDMAVGQDSSTLLIEGGNWSWSDTTDTLAWSADAYIQVPGLAKTRNKINSGSTTLAADGDIAYVDINRTTGIAASITVSTGSIASVEDRVGRVIIGRRIGNTIYVGPQGMLLEDGESKLLGKGGFSTTEFSIVNNVDTPADVTGFLVDPVTNKGFRAEAWINRYHKTNDGGAIDTTFNYGTNVRGFNAAAFAVAVQSDGKILVGGSFTGYGVGGGSSDTQIPDGLARLNSDGTIDTTFNYGAGTRGFGVGATISAIVVQPDGKILVGGTFTQYDGDTQIPDNIARLNSDGTIDTTFNYGAGTRGFNSNVASLALQADGKILAGGAFTSYDGDTQISDGIARLNSDGTIDTTFNYGAGTRGVNGSVAAIVIQLNGKILIGGTFGGYGVGGGGYDADISDHLCRLNADGSIDTTFNYGTGTRGFGTSVTSIVQQDDWKIVVGGAFSTGYGVGGGGYDTQIPTRIARLNSDGTIDTSFNYGTGTRGFNGTVYGLYLQANGQILVVGALTSYDGDTQTPNYITRLNANGSIDTDFNYGAGTRGFDTTAYGVTVQPDGQILVVGNFTTYDGAANAPDAIVRLADNTYADLSQQLTVRGLYSSKALSWTLDANEYLGDDVGVVFTMTTGGQLQYTSTDLSSYGTQQISKMRFIIMGL